MKKTTKIIFDTDIGCDCDDAGALLLLHKLCDRGEAELLCVTHCLSSPYYAGCIDAINRFCGREVPVGINYRGKSTDNRGVYAAELCEKCPNSYPKELYGSEGGALDSATLIRKTLAESEDGEVTLVVVGTLSTMARLIESEGDEYSPLSGEELVEKKIARTVIMGGRFFESWPMPLFEGGDPTHHVMTWEYNIRGTGYEDANEVLRRWRGEIVFSSYEIGSYIFTMRGYGKTAREGDPVALAYRIHNGDTGRFSWDHSAVLEAVRPGVYWNLHEYGRIEVDRDMVTRWSREDGCRHTYLLPKADYRDIESEIDGLVFSH